MPRLTRLSQCIDYATERGWTAEYDDNCGRGPDTIGIVTLSRDGQTLRIGTVTTIANNWEGLNFRPGHGNIETLAELELAVY